MYERVSCLIFDEQAEREGRGVGKNNKTTHHKVPLHKLKTVTQPLPNGIVICPSNLILVEVQPRNVRSPSELHDLASRSTNTAPHVEDLHPRTDGHGVGNVVFMSSDGAVECLAVGEAAEVEALAPSVLVEVGCEVVVSVQQESRRVSKISSRSVSQHSRHVFFPH